MAEETDPKAPARARKIEGITLRQAFDDYLAQRKLKARTESDYKGYMARYFDDWADKPLSAIQRDAVEKRHGALMDESICGATKNAYRGTLVIAFSVDPTFTNEIARLYIVDERTLADSSKISSTDAGTQPEIAPDSRAQQ